MNQPIFYLLLIILLITLFIGLFYYLNQITAILRKCCKKFSSGGSGECLITYPSESIGGDIPNLLSNSDGTTLAFSYDQQTESGLVLPLRADLTSENCTIKVIIKAVDASFGISYVLNQHNWFIRGINTPTLEQTFFSYGPGVADGNFNLQGSGTGVIEVYENGSATPVKTINIQLN